VLGYFINLDRTAGRRASLERQLREFGIEHRYQRFPAVDGRRIIAGRSTTCAPGEVGIFRSHMDALETALGSDKAVHLMEDDIVLSDLMVPAVDAALHRGVFDRHDIVFTEMFVDRKISTINWYTALYDELTERGARRIETPAQVKVVDVGDTYLFGTTSYVVGPHSVNRVLAVLHREWRKGPTMAIDVLLQKAAQARQLSLACFFPFLTTLDFGLARDSAAGRVESSDKALAHRLLRYSFFARRDIAGVALPLIRQALAKVEPANDGGVLDLQSSILRYLLAEGRAKSNQSSEASGELAGEEP
jgi:GR25 family glycosyltransferase involved in LPS biosynthesis